MARSARSFSPAWGWCGLLVLAACGTVRPAAEAGPFRDARAVAFDPAGRAYVIDGDRGMCRATTLGWACVSGSDDVRLVDPVALDATDGLTVLVADRAGQIVRFDREGVVRDRLVPPPEASRTGEDDRFAPVGVVRDARGYVLALDPARGLVRWDAARQFAVVVPPERLPRSARALARDGEGFAILGDGVFARYDAFGTETGRAAALETAIALASDGARHMAVTPTGLQPLDAFAPPVVGLDPASGAVVGAAFDGRRWCWLSRTALHCTVAHG